VENAYGEEGGFPAEAPHGAAGAGKSLTTKFKVSHIRPAVWHYKAATFFLKNKGR